MMYRSVLFPAPDGPVIASASPRASARLTLARTGNSPPAIGNDLLTSATSRSARMSGIRKAFEIQDCPFSDEAQPNLFMRRSHQLIRIRLRNFNRFERPSSLEAAENCLELARRQPRFPPAEVERHRQRLKPQPGNDHVDLDQIVVERRGLEAARGPHARPSDDRAVRLVLDDLE